MSRKLWPALGVLIPIVAFGSATPVDAVDTPLSASPTSIDFGDVDVGQSSGVIDVIITNTGSDPFGPITGFGGAVSDPFDGGQGCGGATLAPGGTCVYSYEFLPTTPGPASDASTFTLSATANEVDGEQFVITLTGCGVESGGACPAAPPCELALSDDIYGTTQDVAVAVAAPGVFGNDAALCGGGFNNFTQPANGVVTVEDDGSFTYQPNAGFTGVDSFDYIVTTPNPVVGPGNASATVTITVSPTVDPGETTGQPTTTAGQGVTTQSPSTAPPATTPATTGSPGTLPATGGAGRT